MELMDAIGSRHSVRQFRPTEVPKESLAAIVSAAAQAPSALNEQPWRFYVSTGDSRQEVGEIMSQNTSYLEEYLQVLGHQPTEDHLRWYSELGGAPVLIALTMPVVDDEFARMNKHISIGAAMQNLLLAATDMGLATCNVTFSYWLRDEISRALGIPDDRTIISMVVLGYPTDEPPIAPPRNDDVVEYID